MKHVDTLRLGTLMLLLLMCSDALGQLEGFKVNKVKTRMVADTEVVLPGKVFRLGVHFKIVKDWHIYWKYPGDSGIPTQLNLKLPEGYEVVGMHWPTPKKFTQAGGLVGYGYEGEVLLYVDVMPPKKFGMTGPVMFEAKPRWYCCNAMTCVEEKSALSLELRTDKQASPSIEPPDKDGPTVTLTSDQQLFEKYEKALPRKAKDEDYPIRGVRVERDGKRVWVVTEWKHAAPAGLDWYPAAGDAFEVKVVLFKSEGKTTRLQFELEIYDAKKAKMLESLFVYQDMKLKKAVSAQVMIPLKEKR